MAGNIKSALKKSRYKIFLMIIPLWTDRFLQTQEIESDVVKRYSNNSVDIKNIYIILR